VTLVAPTLDGLITLGDVDVLIGDAA